MFDCWDLVFVVEPLAYRTTNQLNTRCTEHIMATPLLGVQLTCALAHSRLSILQKSFLLVVSHAGLAVEVDGEWFVNRVGEHLVTK